MACLLASVALVLVATDSLFLNCLAISALGVLASAMAVGLPSDSPAVPLRAISGFAIRLPGAPGGFLVRPFIKGATTRAACTQRILIVKERGMRPAGRDPRTFVA